VSIFGVAFGTLFRSAVSEAGTYLAPTSGAVAVDVRVVRRRRPTDVGFGQTNARLEASVADIAVAELATVEEGATLTVGGLAYTVRAPVMDDERLIWTLDLDPPA
jgi:hypothetical protein